MPQVTGTIVRPDGTPAVGATVKFKLSGASRAFETASGETVYPVQPAIPVDPSDGTYAIDLPANASLNPAGTRWVREVSGGGAAPFRDALIVPVGGGPYDEEVILAEPLEPIPDPTPTNLLDEAVLTADSANLAVDAFTGALVPLSIVTVPDLDVPVLLRGHGSMIHSVANSLCGLAIVVEGGLIASRVDASYAYNGTPATNLVTAYPEAKLDPHSPGNYQLMLYSFTAGTLRIAASNAQRTWLRVFSA